MMTTFASALRANLIWLVVCSVAVIISVFYSNTSVNAVTANFMFTIGAIASAITLIRSASIARPQYQGARSFVYVVAVGLLILGIETAFRGWTVLYDTGDWFIRNLSGPLNILKVSVLGALLVVNAWIQNRGRDRRLAKQIAIGIGACTILYMVLFFVVRAAVA